MGNQISYQQFPISFLSASYQHQLSAEVRDILEVASARWAIAEFYHDVKETCGAGQQQVRNVGSNIGRWNLNQWVYTLVE